MRTIHLMRTPPDDDFGECEAWCGAECRLGRDFATPAMASCEPCLAAAADYGAQAAKQIAALRLAAERKPGNA